MKKILSIICILAIICTFVVLPINASASSNTLSGSGTLEDPYIIADYDDFVSIWDGAGTDEKFHSGTYFKQTADFSVSLNSLKDELRAEKYFAGSYDGDGYKITISNENNTTVSLFPLLAGKLINLTIDGAITYESGAYGALVKTIDTGAEISNCNVSADFVIDGDSNINFGGFLYNYKTDTNYYIKNCAFTGTITANNYSMTSTNVGISPFVYYAGWRVQDIRVIVDNCYYLQNTIAHNNTTVTTAISQHGVSKATDELDAELMNSGAVNIAGACTWRDSDEGPYIYTSKVMLSGSGTLEEPYLISNSDEFLAIWKNNIPATNAETFCDGVYFEQTADFDITVDQLLDRTANTKRFAGIYNGNGYEITLSNSNNNTCSLFNNIRNATVKNLNIAGDIVGDTGSYGVLAKDMSGSSLIINCNNAVNVKSMASNNVNYGGYVYTASPVDDIFPKIVNCTYTGVMEIPNAEGATNAFIMPYIYYINGVTENVVRECYYDSNKTTPVVQPAGVVGIAKTTEEINGEEFCTMLNDNAYSEQASDKTLKLNEWLINEGTLYVGLTKIIVPGVEVKVQDGITNVANDTLSNIDKVTNFIEILFDDEGMGVSTLTTNNILIKDKNEDNISYKLVSKDRYKYIIDITSLEGDSDYTIVIENIKTYSGTNVKTITKPFKTGKIINIESNPGKMLVNVAYERPVVVGENSAAYDKYLLPKLVDGVTGLNNASAISGGNQLYWKIDLNGYYDVVAVETVQRGDSNLVNDTQNIEIKLSTEEYEPFDDMPSIYKATSAGLNGGINRFEVSNENRNLYRYVCYARESAAMLYCEEVRVYAWVDIITYDWCVTKEGIEVDSIESAGTYNFKFKLKELTGEFPDSQMIVSMFDVNGVMLGVPTVQNVSVSNDAVNTNVILDENVKKVTVIIIDKNTKAMLCDGITIE